MSVCRHWFYVAINYDTNYDTNLYLNLQVPRYHTSMTDTSMSLMTPLLALQGSKTLYLL